MSTFISGFAPERSQRLQPVVFRAIAPWLRRCFADAARAWALAAGVPPEAYDSYSQRTDENR